MEMTSFSFPSANGNAASVERDPDVAIISKSEGDHTSIAASSATLHAGDSLHALIQSRRQEAKQRREISELMEKRDALNALRRNVEKEYLEMLESPSYEHVEFISSASHLARQRVEALSDEQRRRQELAARSSLSCRHRRQAPAKDRAGINGEHIAPPSDDTLCEGVGLS
eukprot:TRINITY_DN7223_c1_g2_i1.p1 TRINITY_DN7223_c1_g2~~TRINITY_DN7223_c1_g2_i1.p1  ORF type:complete len:170 (-),score=27.37 TRINITY_DN7223_c1_g2_i1:121-630(-)